MDSAAGEPVPNEAPDAIKVAAARIPLQGWRAVLSCLGIALLSAAIVTVFDAPRIVLWRGLALAEELSEQTAEFDRAVPALAQVRDPWGPVDHSVHKVIAWRLLFPVVWHYLHLPIWLYLAAPHIGCVLALWLVAWLTYGRLQRWWPTLVTTLLMTALPWFFVSSSWLLHFDSWLLLGSLVAALVRSRVALALTCLLVPWIDARFVLSLPVTLAVRAIAFDQISDRRWREWLTDLMVVGVASVPYPAVRTIAAILGDPDTANYLKSHWDELQTIPWHRFVFGVWSGYRVAWLGVLAALVLTLPRIGWRWGILFGLLVIGTALGSLVIAWDMSRSLMMIGPVLLLGIWLSYEWQPAAVDWVAPALLAANLLLPAHHVMWTVDWRLDWLKGEIDKWRDPPNIFAAVEYVQQARQMIKENRLAEARQLFDAALATESNYPQAFVERAVLRLNGGDLAGAEADVEDAIRLRADYPYAFLLRGALRENRGELDAARADYQHSLEIARPGWPYHEQAVRLLQNADRPPAAPAAGITPQAEPAHP